MRELIDCHVHTERCGHAVGTVDDYARAAVKRGLVGLAITEHLALPDDLDPDRRLSMPACDLEAYLVEVDLTAQRYPDITLIAGLEADYLPGREAQTAAAIAEARNRSDGARFILGSVHFIGEWAFDDPHSVHEWDRRDVDEAWADYFSLWEAAARTGLFDCMAHPDLPKKFGHRPTLETREMYASAARTAAEAGVLVEISTAGLRRPVRELYPGHDLLMAFCAEGVPVTVGSDAHEPDEVGYRIDAAYDAAALAGYTEVQFPDGFGRWRSIEL